MALWTVGCPMHVGHLAAFLASTHKMLVDSSPNSDNQKCLQREGGKNYPRLRTIDIKQCSLLSIGEK